jgi:hypothetical protein
MKTILKGAAAAAAVLFASAGAANAATELFSFTDATDGISASGTLTVDNTANANGTFDITAVTGSVTHGAATDAISGIIGSPNTPNPTVNFGFIYDNVVPFNTNGVLFQGVSGAIYNLWSNGGEAGELYTYGLPNVAAFDAHGTLGVSAGVPEPASWAVMLTGFAGIGAAIRSSRRKLAAA